MKNLRSAVEGKSGQKLISCDVELLRCRLGYDIGSMQQSGLENIQKALVSLAASLESFLSDLLNDKLEKQLDELD